MRKKQPKEGEEKKPPKEGEDKKKPPTPEGKTPGAPKEKTPREEELDRKIADAQLNHNIKRSIDNFEKIKSEYKDELTSSELNSINQSIEQLNELN